MGLFKALVKTAAGVAVGGPIGGVVGFMHEVVTDTNDQDKIREGFEKGLKVGAAQAADKYDKDREDDLKYKMGAYALGMYIAGINGRNNMDYELDVIEAQLGTPDSIFKDEYTKSQLIEIIEHKLSYEEIKSTYLDQLTHEQARDMHDYVYEVIHANGGLTGGQRTFWNTKWFVYMDEKGWDIKKV